MPRTREMNRKRCWEVCAASTLALVLSASGCAYAYLQRLNQQLEDAIRRGDAAAARRCSRSGASISPTRELFILGDAAFSGNIRTAQVILDRGVSINALDPDNEHRTALMSAIRGVDPAMVRFLLHHEAQVNLRDDSGYTALGELMQTHPQLRTGRSEYQIDPDLDRASAIARMLRRRGAKE